MKKAPDAFRTISEVAEWLEVQAHVLRFWESKFSQIKPVKRAGGRRYYRQSDMRLIGGIKTLLHGEGMTIKGVQKILREKGVEHVSSFSKPLEFDLPEETPAIEMPADGSGSVPGDIKVDAPADVTGADAPPEAAAPDLPAPEAAEPAAEARESPEARAEAAAEAGTVFAFHSRQARRAAFDAEDGETEDEPAVTGAGDVRSDLSADDDPAPDQPHLPSFLHRSARPQPEPEAASPATPPPVVPGPPRPRIVDAPDPPHEDEIAVEAGVLGRLARVDAVPKQNLAALSALLAELKALAAAHGARQGGTD